MSQVVVVGAVNVDRVLRCEVLPSPGETVVASSTGQGFGGKGGNQAVAAACAGVPTVLVAAVGNDASGTAAASDLRTRGVDATGVVVLESVPTGAATVFVDRRGENFIVLEPGANGALDARTVSVALAGLRPGDVVLSSCEVPADAVRAAVQASRRAGATHVHNLAPFRGLPAWTGHDHVILVANQLEAQQATGLGTPTAAAARLAERRRAAVVTVGALGAVLADGSTCVAVPSPRVTAVDTTGAGDAFCGALAASVAQGVDLRTAVERAVHAGAAAVMWSGARDPVTDRDAASGSIAVARDRHGAAPAPPPPRSEAGERAASAVPSIPSPSATGRP